jgi:hypothetical protein
LPDRLAHRRLRLGAIATSACLAVVGLSSCGSAKVAHSSGGQQVANNIADANNNGGYVDAGGVTYQMQVSRQLNPYDVEDSQYVRGLPRGMSITLPADQLWYGVFLWALNQTHQPQTTTDNFVIQDTLGNKYYPLRVNTALNQYAWTSQKLAPLETEPAPDTLQSHGPTQGGLLLFRLNTSVYANRPLTLYILSPSGQRQASISLDL